MSKSDCLLESSRIMRESETENLIPLINMKSKEAAAIKGSWDFNSPLYKFIFEGIFKSILRFPRNTPFYHTHSTHPLGH